MKKLNMKKNYYVGVCHYYISGCSYSIYSQTNSLKKAFTDKYHHELANGGYGVILSKAADGKLYPITAFDTRYDGKEDYEFNYNRPVDDLTVIFKNITEYKFDGKNYIAC